MMYDAPKKPTRSPMPPKRDLAPEPSYHIPCPKPSQEWKMGEYSELLNYIQYIFGYGITKGQEEIIIALVKQEAID